jgi:hypothetical protein
MWLLIVVGVFIAFILLISYKDNLEGKAESKAQDKRRAEEEAKARAKHDENKEIYDELDELFYEEDDLNLQIGILRQQVVCVGNMLELERKREFSDLLAKVKLLKRKCHLGTDDRHIVRLEKYEKLLNRIV